MKKVSFKGGGADSPPRDNVINVSGLRYSATAKASGAKGSGGKLRGAYGLPCSGFIWGVSFIAGGALFRLAPVGFTICGAMHPRRLAP